MTIILERPDSATAHPETHVVDPETTDAPYGDTFAQASSLAWLPSQAAPFGTPAPAPSAAAALPPGVRLVRRHSVSAPTLTAGRKLTMLAPVALLAGVSAGGVALVPHLQGLAEAVRSHLESPAAASSPEMTEHRAAPKHRAATPTAPEAARLPKEHQPRHRAVAPESADSAPTDTAPSSPVGAHQAAPTTSSDSPATSPTGGKHKADVPADSAGQDDASSPTQRTEPPADADTAPSTDSTQPDSGTDTTDPVQDLLGTAGTTVDGLTTTLGLGG